MSHLEKLIEDLKESLEREVRDGFARVEERLDDVTRRFDAQAARLERQGALWQTGRRWSARMDDWAERLDSGADALSKAIADLTERVRQLESKHGPGGGQ